MSHRRHLTCPGGFVNFPHQRHEHRLNQHVLVLNRLWQAVNVCTAAARSRCCFQGQAQVVVNAEDGSFHTFDFRNGATFPQTRRRRNPSAPFPSAFACRESFCCSFTSGCPRRR